MALTKKNYENGKTVITAENLNEIQDAIIALEGAAGDDGTHPAYYIDLAGDYPDYTCSVAMADIKAAYEAGKVLKCRCAMGLYTATLPLCIPMPSANTWLFSGAGALTVMDFPAQSLTIAIVNGTVQASDTQLASKDDIPAALPNPNALTIKIGSTTVTYDGSSAQTVEDYLAEHPAASASMRVEGGYIQFSGDGKTWGNVIALADLKGAPGENGAPGKPGADGLTPHIGENGNWYLGDEDTGKPSRGAPGAKGDPGKDGAGMDVTGATVGQIAKISAVDASGVPTGWVAVDMPAGGGRR